MFVCKYLLYELNGLKVHNDIYKVPNGELTQLYFRNT